MNTNTKQEELKQKAHAISKATYSWQQKVGFVSEDDFTVDIDYDVVNLINSEVTAVLDELENRARMLNHNGELLSLNGEPMKVVSIEAIQQLKQRYGE